MRRPSREWNVRLIALGVLLVLGLLFNFKVNRYHELVWEGQLRKLICVGRVVSISTDEDVYQRVEVKVLSGPFRGQTVTATNPYIGRAYADRVLHRGDTLLLEIPMKREGEIEKVYLGSYYRNPFLLNLLLLFLALLILVGGATGVQAIISLGITGALVFFFFVPLAIRGYPPIPLALAVAGVDTILTFVIVGGWHRKILAGALGTLGGLAASGLLATLAVGWMHSSGLDVTFGLMKLGVRHWAYEMDRGWHWDHQGILVAGIILGASGAIMDVGMAISAGVEEVRLAHPEIRLREAIRSGFNIGRDIMGTMANTLIFAYVGADMALTLLPGIEFPELGHIHSFFRLINQDGPSAEALYALMGTLGLVLSVPITATIAGLLAITHRKKPRGEGVPVVLEEPEIAAPSDLDDTASEPHDGKREAPSQTASPPRKRRPLQRWAIPLFLAMVVLGTHLLYSHSRHHGSLIKERVTEDGLISRSEYAKARAVRILDTYPTGEGNAIVHMIEAEILGGTYKGQRVVLRNQVRPGGFPLLSIRVKVGDVFLARVGGVDGKIGSVNLVQDYDRDGVLVFVGGLLMFLIVLVGRWEGIRTLVALTLSGGTIYFITLPLIHGGQDPLIVTTLTCALIAAVSLFIVAGFNRKSTSAILGTVGGVLLAAIIMVYAQQYLHLRGTENYTAAELIEAEATTAVKLDFRRLLLAGMLLGLLGAAMDGAIDVASSMEEVRRVNPRVTRRYLIRAGMNVGTDVIGTMSNTLIYAYIGFRLLLILTALGTNLFPFTHLQLLSVGVISAEVVRALAGSIGLIISVPLTILIFALWVGHRGEPGPEA